MVKVKNKYDIKRDYISKGKSRSGLKNLGIEFLVAHETANNKADAEDHQRYFGRNIISASAHTFIDDKEILEIIPLDEKAWHVNYNKPYDNQIFGEDANDAAIGTELCRTGVFSLAYDKYAWYHAYLCKKFDLDPETKIISHKRLDPQRRSDPESWLNPNGITWSEFIADVKKYYDTWDQEIGGSKKVSGGKYQIESGDTFWAIAREQGVDLDDLLAANKGQDPESLQPGQWINIPGKAAADPEPKKEDPKPVEKYPLPDAVIKLTSPQTKGEAVLQIQKALAALYFYPDKGAPSNGCDGYFGPKTEDALERFQSVYTPYEVDGIFGPKTKAALETQLKKRGLK